MDVTTVLGLVNLFFAVGVGLYVWNLVRAQQTNRAAVDRESRRELEKLQRLRAISLTEPLSERIRPTEFADIVGQADALRALRAALCGPNPQHVIVYGPPGVGKTAAARLVLEEAKRDPRSPFGADARFVEIDATTARFDERGIADPLIGSVHDPIYQGAGPLGMAGVPQPKPGAVTRAHGGILFLDEIGELHPLQLNKLLKVLEDRRVFLESAYYSSDDPNIPPHVHEIFQNGLPADFRLVGATTRLPAELPPALRSRCLEVFFRALTPEEIGIIARRAADKAGLPLDSEGLELIARYAANGREAVNMVQIAAGLALSEGRSAISRADVEWVVESGQYALRPVPRIDPGPAVGRVYGLAVTGPNQGAVIEVEAAATPVRRRRGRTEITGAVDEEEVAGLGRTLRRKSSVRGSVENMVTVLRQVLGVEAREYDLHINFPGGVPVDGPSAGAAMVTAAYSAITGLAVRGGLAMTGEVSIRGWIRPVGGVAAKLEAARLAGAREVLVPSENWQESFARKGNLVVTPVKNVEELIATAVPDAPLPVRARPAPPPPLPLGRTVPVTRSL